MALFDQIATLKWKICILWITIFFYGISASYAQDNACHKSTEGKDFWFGVMENIAGSDDRYIEVTVTARETTKFRITVGAPAYKFDEEYTVVANNSIQIKIPLELVVTIGSEEIQERAIHLTSEKPVNVYALNYERNTSDAALIFPVESLGKEYFAMCYYPDHNAGDPDRSNSQFLIVATEDSTLVEITPVKVTDKLKPKDSTFVVTINRGEVYQVQSENSLDKRALGQGDLTGSYISSNKPIAFYSGAQSTTIPSGVCCWDHLYEQIPPIHSWGLEYYLVPLKSRLGDRYRIMAANDNTTVYISGEQPFKLNRGQFREMAFSYNDPKRILSDKPVLVAQYSQSRDFDSNYTGGNGDPFMIILSSSTQSKNNVTFVAFDSNQIKKYFVNIISPAEETGNIVFDGNSIESQFTPFPDGKYSYAQLTIEPGTYNIYNTNGDRGFIAYVYGYGGIESYGYGVGYNLDLVLDLGKSINFEGDTLLLCYGDSRTLDAGSFFDNYIWNTGDTTQTLTINEGGRYHVTASTLDGCVLEDSIYLFVSHPEVDLGIEYDQGCEPYSVELDAGEGFDNYLWQNEDGDTLSTSQKFTADKTGKYIITVFDRYGCTASDTMNLQVFPVPDIEISGPQLVCDQLSAQLTVSITGTAESVWNNQNSFEWSSNKPSSLTFSEEAHTSVKVEASEWGAYEIYYRLVTEDGCEKKDTFFVKFHPQPTSDFYLETDEKCEGYSQKLIFSGSASDSADFYWDIGGCQFLDTLGDNVYLISVGAFLDEPPYISLYIDDNGCLSETTKTEVGAKPNFTMDAWPTHGCDSLTVNFTSTLITPDNVNFRWEFDDGTSANTQNVKKHYTKPGVYGAKLTITNPVTGCRNSYSIDSMITIDTSPEATIIVNTDICYDDSTMVFFPFDTDSTYCHWEFDGITKIGGSEDSVKILIVEPTGTAQLVVEERGCFSVPAEVKLNRKPHFDFFYDNRDCCLPCSIEIFADPQDENLTFRWMTDSIPFPTGNSNIFVFSEPGIYDIGLIAESDETGCSDTLIKTGFVKVSPQPIAAYDVDYQVALIENANITFTNRSEYADIFYWDFGDGNHATGQNAKHTYTELGEYKTQLIAESVYGCRDTAELTISVLAFSKYAPNAFRPDSHIEENRTFRPVGEGADPSKFNLKIFNRNGQVVFETDSPEDYWDGTAPDGKPAPMGNYVWIARYYDVQGFKHTQKGQVLLIR